MFYLLDIDLLVGYDQSFAPREYEPPDKQAKAVVTASFGKIPAMILVLMFSKDNLTVQVRDVWNIEAAN